MADAEAPNEAFKRNTGAALRALSAVRELEVTFGPENATTDGRTARLPTPSRDLPPGEVAILRGEADALAMKLRHHDEDAHVEGRPPGGPARSCVRCSGASALRSHWLDADGWRFRQSG